MYCFQAVTDCAIVMSAWASRSGSLNARRCLEPLAMAAWALAFQVEPAAAFHLLVAENFSGEGHIPTTRSETASNSQEIVIGKKTHSIGTYSTPELRLPLGV